MAKKSSIWSSPSKYGTYTGEKGNPNQWAGIFSEALKNSDSAKNLTATSAFTVIGVSPTATEDEVKTAFRKIVRQCHQDSQTGQNDPVKFRTATEAFKLIRENRRKAAERREAPDDDIDIGFIPQLLTETDEDDLARLLDDDDFCAQEKKDGKHLSLHLTNGILTVRNKKGIGCECDSEFKASLSNINPNILIDGEQVNGIFYTWDILELGTMNLRILPYLQRYHILNQLRFGPKIKILDIIVGKAAKVAFYNKLEAQGKEGIVFKKMSAIFSPGKGLDQFKFKFYAECSVIVVEGRTGKASIGMELFNGAGDREFVGYCSCSRHPPIGSVVEIKYLYAYRNGCLYQPSFKEIRDDVDVSECKMTQLKYKSEDA